jgi:asparagine synthase (glutamine-hydrolysing)
MCGIVGYLSTGRSPEDVMLARVAAMAEAIANRGPDSRGHWVDEATGIAFGHLRLAIVDLSEAGAQPMVSPSGRFTVVFNGEFYNHGDLRRELDEIGKAPAWRGHSDTETFLAAVDAWGVEATLKRMVGMFAIALWDHDERRLLLARDRMGEKPLYYGWQGKGSNRTLLFGSELKALAMHPAFEGQVDRNVLPEFLRHGYIGGDRSIYRGIGKVLPGEIVVISVAESEPKRHRYWSGADISANRTIRHFTSPDSLVDEFEALLRDAVGRQMASDVPLGAFLSGGVDSSAVVALMQVLSDTPVHTFSIGFHEERYNEAEHARAVAKHLGTHHTDLYVDEKTLLSVVPLLPRMFDEPHADSSQIPTYLVAKLAREHVTVALSGDGGDELFSGYDRYQQGVDFMAGPGRLPLWLRRGLASGLRSIPRSAYDAALDRLRPVPQGKENNGQRIWRLANYLRYEDTDSLHKMLVSFWKFPETAVPGAVQVPTLLDQPPPRGNLTDMERMMQLDMLSYMVDDILAKVDRATMAVSLESRAPLLDHRVVEFAWSLPLEYKRRNGISKWALRQVLYRHVPEGLINRPKMGFEVPIGLWLRGPLKDWAAALLDRDRLGREGWFDADVVARHWDEHLAGKANWGLQLWPVCVFQAWLESQSAGE